MYIYIIEILLYIIFYVGIFSSFYLIFFNKDKEILIKNKIEKDDHIKHKLESDVKSDQTQRTLGMGSLNKAINVNELKQRATSREKDIISLTNFKER